MRRIVVVGNSGTGKSTLARRLADDLGLQHIELDALFHGPNWTPTPADEFQAKIRSAMEEADERCDGWTMCGNYNTPSARIHQQAADTIVWLDMPKWLIMRRVTARTLRRAFTRERLWNGNREPLTNFYRWDPQENIIRWAWTQYDEYRKKILAAMADDTWAHATVHHLRSPEDVERFASNASRDG